MAMLSVCLFVCLSVRWRDWPLTWLTNHHPSLLRHCWLGHVIRKTVSEMTYNVSSGTLNTTIPVCPLKRVTRFPQKLNNLELWSVFLYWPPIGSLTGAFQRTHFWTLAMTLRADFKITFADFFLHNYAIWSCFSQKTTLFRATPCYAWWQWGLIVLTHRGEFLLFYLFYYCILYLKITADPFYVIPVGLYIRCIVH